MLFLKTFSIVFYENFNLIIGFFNSLHIYKKTINICLRHFLILGEIFGKVHYPFIWLYISVYMYICILCISINVSLTGCFVASFMLYLNDIQARIKNTLEKNKCFFLTSIWKNPVGHKTCFYPLNTERNLKLLKAFRRCPRCLLNVLGSFNLHPVSIG